MTPIKSNPEEVLDALRRAREYLEDDGHWCVGASAIDGNGRACRATDGEAVAYCAIGVLSRSCGKRWQLFDDAVACVEAAAFRLKGVWLTKLNDDYGRQAVLDAFDLAILNLAEPSAYLGAQ